MLVFNPISNEQGRPCQSCNQRPATHALSTSVSGSTEERLLCYECMVDFLGDQNIGIPRDIMDYLFRPRGAEQAIQGPATHPEPGESLASIIVDAVKLSAAGNSPLCDTHHLLAAMLRSADGRAALNAFGVNDSQLQQLSSEIHQYVPLDTDASAHTEASVNIRFAPGATNAFMISRRRAARERRRLIEPRHLVQGLLVEYQSTAARLLRGAGASEQEPEVASPSIPATQHAETPALDRFSIDLTSEAADGRIDPVIGRHDEIEMAVEILSRRRKNNVALIGEPGVGKTAIAEGLALRIVNGEVPETLKDRRLVSLDLAGLVAGTQMRGEFEQRLQALLDEVKRSEGQIILFIDELHTLVGAGGAQGALDAANMLKPLLARGELHVIGATTLTEYKRIEKDGALARRFQSVLIEEPSVEETVEIIRGLKEGYEAHHRALISDEAIIAAARLSDRYVSEQFLPDKAIDLVDQAGSRVRLRTSAQRPALQQAEQKLEELREEKDQAVAREDFNRAQEIKNEIEELQQEILSLAPTVEDSQQTVSVTDHDIAEVIASRTGIPVGELMASEIERLRSLEQDLHERVIGQDDAVEKVSDAIRRARAGMSDPERPTGVFLFLGPTGVGKTELAKTLAQRLWGTEKALIRIDMSEYGESHSTARLVGSPPGYVGHGEGGQLTEAVRRRPYSVLLLDEVEKANESVHRILLQLLDDGRLTDGEGRTVDFRNTVIIMTSNVGAGEAKRSVGFAADQSATSNDQTMKALKRTFSPEFLNRIDETIVFQALSPAEIADVTELLCTEISHRLKEEHGIDLAIDEELAVKLAEDGFDSEYGARPLRRHLRRTLEKAIVDAILDGSASPGDSLVAAPGPDGQIVLRSQIPA